MGGGDVAGCYRGLSVAGHPVHSGVAYALKLDVVLCYGVVVFCVVCVCVCVLCVFVFHWGCIEGGLSCHKRTLRSANPANFNACIGAPKANLDGNK